MALLHRAELHPTKLELLAGWLRGRRWFREQSAADVVRVASFRLDDPAGAVGIETMLVMAGSGPVYQVPLTYRDAALEHGDDWLVGIAEHSVLGRRWVYDACGDPVYAAVLTSAIFAGPGRRRSSSRWTVGSNAASPPRPSWAAAARMPMSLS